MNITYLRTKESSSPASVEIDPPNHIHSDCDVICFKTHQSVSMRPSKDEMEAKALAELLDEARLME